MATWTREQTLNLIESFEQFPNLYKIHHVGYKNRFERRRNLLEIVERIKLCRPKTTLKDISLKLKTLKTQYLKEKNKLMHSKQCGTGTSDIYVPKLWCYGNLAFWDDTHDNIPGTSSISPPPFFSEVDIGKTEFIPRDYPASGESSKCQEVFERSRLASTSETTQLEKKLSPTRLEVQVGEAIKTAKNILDAYQKRRTSPLQPFLDNLEAEMTMITDEDLLTDTRWKILEVVREAQIKQKVLPFNIKNEI